MRKTLLLLVVALISLSTVKADEGMWLPQLLKKYNIEEMRKAGFKLTAEDIYSVNQACLKDAVVGLGREGSPFHHFCTGEIISDKGLMVTNHHCGFGAIQQHSSLEHNYLKDGFWAMSMEEELSNPGITASFMISMEEVTAKIEKIKSETTDRKEIAARVKEITKKAVEGTNHRASIKAFFAGNQYFMTVYKIYKDVRLVGAPPSAIGKFGGDTDNWSWPRHTGDFSMFRIYADVNNEPASYSEKNIPLTPKRSLAISLKGVQENDFTMVFGYPGTTKEYLTSYAIKQVVEIENPEKIEIRTKKLNIINEAMNSSELLRIKYAAKAAGVANSWKRWIGEIKGLKRFNTIEEKQKLEAKFTQWVNQSAKRVEKYGNVLPKMAKLYAEKEKYAYAYAYAIEAGYSGAEIVRFLNSIYSYASKYKAEETDKKEAMIARIVSFYKDYDMNTDKKIFKSLISHYMSKSSDEFLPKELKRLKGKNLDKIADKIFAKSRFTNAESTLDFIVNYSDKRIKKLDKDPLVKIARGIINNFRKNVGPKYYEIDNKVTALQKTWLAGLMEMQADKTFYADANSTFRVAYGKVKGYEPKDGVYYKHYTTLEGIMAKDNPDIYDYDVPAKLRELYKSKDYGRYTQEGQVPVCFVANNHTTGGNSGSPVLNANGELIGLNFDRAWDGVMSDMQYDAEICRNIALDIRYVLFIVDKYAGATRLIEEMNIVE
jgi:V8-like Glu-specific endopeptidase